MGCIDNEQKEDWIDELEEMRSQINDFISQLEVSQSQTEESTTLSVSTYTPTYVLRVRDGESLNRRFYYERV